MLSQVAILAVRLNALREAHHSAGNGYIRFVNDCDPDRYLDDTDCGAPAARRVRRRHSHSSGPWRK
ncbi:hypothetical protein C5952_22025 [Cronobacter sakazakii]|uniref:Uncharacterized protein n=1 Tax=Cronobacter sakazakii TaxID=28141 RepID=A0A9X7IVV0_CROSK|nr:hypothetical protein CsakCS09_12460 [Cronobacter sakazakii]AZP32961.1 hypothetical protein DC438_07400 [Cronobacter sakazakii]EGT4238086.1 hypothetical protein [Cronobacter sakazakii]EGT4258231.1 hypothetical protein [Cronobacter sakazakii]EGT4273079.1 hypothetical protein [Cronobacter sakazakii]